MGKSGGAARGNTRALQIGEPMGTCQKTDTLPVPSRKAATMYRLRDLDTVSHGAAKEGQYVVQWKATARYSSLY